jgi:probable HAF family extracellular repeat protein
MLPTPSRTSISLAALVVLSCLSIYAEAQVRYRVVKLPSIVGNAEDAYLSNISNKAGLVGAAQVLGAATHAFRFNQGAGMRFLPSLGGSCSFATSLNDLNHAAGNACLPGDVAQHAVLWQGNTVLDLDTFGGVSSNAYRVNNYDNVAGSFTLSDGSQHGFFWQQGAWTDLGMLGGSKTYALDVNDFDSVTGSSDISNDPQPPFKIPPFHGFVWNAGVMTEFGSLFGADFNYGSQIDSAGRVVGISDLAGDTAAHGFVWDQGNIVQDLEPLPSNQISWAFAMNSSGSIVGSSGLFDGGSLPPAYEMLCPCYGVLWENGQIIRLNDVLPSGWTIDLAIDINDRGEILGTGMRAGDYQELNILLQPIHDVDSTAPDTGERPRAADYSGPRVISRDLSGRLRFVR